MCCFSRSPFRVLTYKTGTGWITSYGSIAGKHLQALPQAPHRMRIDEKGAWFGITAPVDLVVGEQIVIGGGQPILEGAIVTSRIPGGNRNVPKDRRMRKIKLRLGHHLKPNDWQWLMDANEAPLGHLLGNWRHVLWSCCPHPLRVRGSARDWISWRCRGYLAKQVASIRVRLTSWSTLTYEASQLGARQRTGAGDNRTGLDALHVAKEFLARKEATEGQLIERRILAAQDAHTRLHYQAAGGIILLLETVPKDGLIVDVVVIGLVERLAHRALKGLHNAAPEGGGLVVAFGRVFVVAKIQFRTERQFGVLGHL